MAIWPLEFHGKRVLKKCVMSFLLTVTGHHLRFTGHSDTLDSKCTSVVVLLDPKNMVTGVGISLPSCLQPEIRVLMFREPPSLIFLFLLAYLQYYALYNIG